MYIVAIAWLYVAVLMAVAEATGPQGSVLGALVTLVLYGLLPLAIVLYVMGAPARRRALRAREQAASVAGNTPDAGGQPPAGAVPPVGKEP